ncbi:hypothetical protein BGZ73_003987 [Actinomortierella ambigua]|nr:hypothetical protein BGZ73_003987 [Actinomortierella ambigua]
MQFQYIKRLQTDLRGLINNESGHDVKFLVVDAAERLGLEQLLTECEKYAWENVNASTVCALMVLANQYKLKNLWTTTTEYFDTHAERLLSSDVWYSLEMDLMINVLSRDSIGASELSVWKAIVRYAYFANNYDDRSCPLVQLPNSQSRLVVEVLDQDNTNGSSVNNSSNQEHTHTSTLQTAVVKIPRAQFNKIRNTITPLLSAVRFTSLDVTDFIRAIEGTRLISPELCNRVNRHHNMPLEFPCDPAPPRGTMLLPRDRWPTLISWLQDAMGGTSRPAAKILYMASRHGFNADAFHRYCDQKGPTLTIACTSAFVIVGGFNATGWSSNGSWSPSAKNFLFQYNIQTGQMLRANLIASQNGYAAYNSSKYGPLFGYGYDLRIMSDGRGSSMKRASYNMDMSWVQNDFNVIDYEVFKLDIFQTDLNHLVNSENRHDIKFLIGSEEVARYGHSQILVARCPYFATALRSPWRESSDGVFYKPNIEPKVFDIILRYLYTGQVTLTADVIPSFIEAAVELQLKHLAFGCEDYACENVGKETVCMMMAVASRHNLKKLLSTSVSFFCLHAEELLNKDDWLNLDMVDLINLFSRSSLIAKELTVWKAVIRYAYHRENTPLDNRPLLQFPEWPSRLRVKLLEEASLPQVNMDGNGQHSTSNPSTQHGEGRSTAGASTRAVKVNDIVVYLSREQHERFKTIVEFFLSVIRFARFKLVDFARCIEGTGLVPVDLVLKVYWHHALPADFSDDFEPPCWFDMALLPIEQWSTLLEWAMEAVRVTWFSDTSLM